MTRNERPAGLAQPSSADARLEELEREAIQEGDGVAINSEPAPDLRHAKAFTEALTGSANAALTFQTFDDSSTKAPDLARVINGTLDFCARELKRLNSAGAGIFATVNETDLRGRRGENIRAVRALFADCDAGAPTSYPLDPSFVVQPVRGPHPYWLLQPGVPGDQFAPAQRQLASFYGSDRAVCDLPRVMRLPGFLHRKGKPVLVTFSGGSMRHYTLDQVLAAHPVHLGSERPPSLGRPMLSPASVLAGVPEGERDVTLYRYACSLRARRYEWTEAEVLILAAARNCEPPFPDREAILKLRSAWNFQAGVDGGRQPETPTAVLTRLDTVQREKVLWLWKSRIPFGKITVFDGDPGLGKSTVCDDITARITRGHDLPDGEACEAGDVLILSAEDGLADTIRPRIEAAGGDVSHVTVLEAVRRRDGKLDLFSLTDDIEVLRLAIATVRPKLVRIDPFSAYVGTANTWKDQEIRRVMAPLAAVAQEFGTAVALVRHLNKTHSNNATYRGGGSIGIIGAARSGLLFLKDPDDETGGRILVVTYKSNLSKPGSTLAYTVTGSNQDPDIAVVAWEPCTDSRSAEQIMASAGETFEERSARGDARGWLRNYLAGGPQPAARVFTDSKKEGIALKTLRRAFKEVGRPRKDGLTGPWLWELT